MERKFYEINEKTAMQAHNMMSFGDYIPESKTNEYRILVNKCYDLADKVAAKKPERAGDAYYFADRYSKKLAENFNKDSEIGCRCPSVMIAGPANFPVRKKEKQIAAWDKNHQEYIAINKYLERIENILHGKEVILSDNAKAVDLLQDKLDTLIALQEKMRAANKALRLKDTKAGNDELMGMGYSELEIKNLRTPDFCGRVGYPDYALSNNNANIHRIEARIEELKKIKAAGTSETSTEFFRVVRNTENMRLQLFFSGKPEPEVRNTLKSNGFLWAPSQGCWQRQLNNNAEYALNRVIASM